MTAHEFLGVPLSDLFVFRGVELRVLDHSRLSPRPAPTDAVVYSRLVRRYGGPERLTGARVHYTVEVDGQQTMTAQISSACRSPAEWDALRAASRAQAGLPPDVGAPYPPPPRIAAELVDRRNPYNVVISDLVPGPDGGRSARLVVDTSHPTMFDHPLDHVPGMLELEAFRQLAVATGHETTGRDATGRDATGRDATGRDATGPYEPSRRLVALSGRFLSFVELDLPAMCDVVVTGGATAVNAGAELTAHCAMHQGGRRAAVAEVRLAPAPADHDPLAHPSLSLRS
jgi:hypothetical protein